MRRLALKWLWWAFVWDILCYCARNPFRFFLALPLWLIGSICIAITPPAAWRQRVYWNMGQAWDAIAEGEVWTPPLWLFRRLDPHNYTQLGDRSCDSEN